MPQSSADRSWSAQDRRPLVPSQSRISPSQRGYVDSPTMHMPGSFESLPQRPSPPRSARQTSSGHGSSRHPTQAAGASRATETWQFPHPQLTSSASFQSSLRAPTPPQRPRANSSAGYSHPTLQIPQSSPPLRHKYSYSDGNGHGNWPNDDEIGDAFDVSIYYCVIKGEQCPVWKHSLCRLWGHL
jgi:hypothetical protein